MQCKPQSHIMCSIWYLLMCLSQICLSLFLISLPLWGAPCLQFIQSSSNRVEQFKDFIVHVCRRKVWCRCSSLRMCTTYMVHGYMFISVWYFSILKRFKPVVIFWCRKLFKNCGKVVSNFIQFIKAIYIKPTPSFLLLCQHVHHIH